MICRLFCLFLFPFLFTGCKQQKDMPQQNITINITNEPNTLDPRKARVLTDVNIIRMLMDGLTRIGADGVPVLAIAQDVSVSEDLTTYTFTLKNAKWTNGDPVTAQDFAYAWKTTLSPTFNAPNAHMLCVIKNAKQAKAGALPLSLVGIETPDAKTLVVQLDYPIPYFLELLSHPIYFPVNSSIDRVDPQWYKNHDTYVGNGPFVPCGWKHHQEIDVKKNEQYWDEKTVQIAGIKMIMVNENTGLALFESKQLHWEGSPFSTIPIDSLHGLKLNKQLKTVSVLATEWIRVNVDSPSCNSKKLRKAFALAIDRKEIVNHVTQLGDPSTGIVPPSMKLQLEPLFFDGDSAAAQCLFKEAVEELNMSCPCFTLTYISSERNHRIAQVVQQQWNRVFNIHVDLEPLDGKVFFERMSKKDYTLALENWFADFNDPISFLEIFKSKTVGTNNTNWENPNYTQLLDRSLICQNIDERKALLTQSEQLLIEDMPVIPLFHSTMCYIQDDLLQNVVLTNLGNIDFKYAYLKGK